MHSSRFSLQPNPKLAPARNSDPTYGQGLQRYAKRYGTFYADTGIGTLMTTSVFPTFLHQDPRYYQLGKSGIWHRTIYAMSRILLTRSDSGALQFNFGNRRQRRSRWNFEHLPPAEPAHRREHPQGLGYRHPAECRLQCGQGVLARPAYQASQTKSGLNKDQQI